MSDILRETEKETVKAVLYKLLSGEGWKTALFIKDHMPLESVYESEEKVRKAPVFPYGGLNNPETVEDDVKGCLMASVEKIAEWATGKSRVLRLEFNMDYDIGYMLESPTAEKTPSKTLVMSIRRDNEGKTQHGFYVSAFNPI